MWEGNAQKVKFIPSPINCLKYSKEKATEDPNILNIRIVKFLWVWLFRPTKPSEVLLQDSQFPNTDADVADAKCVIIKFT